MDGHSRIKTLVNVPVVIEPRDLSPTRYLEAHSPTYVYEGSPVSVDRQRASQPPPNAVHALQYAANSDIQIHNGYLSGPNIEGSPCEMTLAEAHKTALSHPSVKGFSYQNRGQVSSGSDRVWVYFKASFDFHPSQGWTAVQVLRHSELGNVPNAKPGSRPGLDTATRDRLVRFYQEYCPGKLPQVVLTMNEYKGMEDSLFASLVRRHGPEPPTVPLDADLPPEWKCIENSVGYVFYVHSNGGRQWMKPKAGDPPPTTDPLLMPDQAPSPHGMPMASPRYHSPQHHASPQHRMSPRWRRTKPVCRAVLISTTPMDPTKFSKYLGEMGYKQQLVLSMATKDTLPTKANFLRALNWLVNDTQDGDVLLFYFNGEGASDTLLTHDEPVSGREVAEVLELSHIEPDVRMSFIIDASPGAKVFDLAYRMINLAPRTTIIDTPKEPLRAPCNMVVIQVLDGSPVKGSLTRAFMCTVTSTKGCKYEELLERLRSSMGSGGYVLGIACTEASITGCYSITRDKEDATLQSTQGPDPSASFLGSPSYASSMHAPMQAPGVSPVRLPVPSLKLEVASLLGDYP
eukprot:TRINITY_DN9638_c0_g1_i3.p1 TRINITY_DN9638_c0_g1~~TRINITY_DN9638_c0_g1_i3.p1  ORF type:complete len:572 (+),score=115.40 TRINITY_DN9638_c0_g1_i3:37-1752(+)